MPVSMWFPMVSRYVFSGIICLATVFSVCSNGFSASTFSEIAANANLVSSDINSKIVDKAKSYDYVREATNNNDAPEITMFLKHAGLGPGYAWCQVFYNYCGDLAIAEYNRCHADNRQNLPKLASVARMAKYMKHRPTQFKIITGREYTLGREPVPGSLISFKHGKAAYSIEGAYAGEFEYKGHAAIYLARESSEGMKTIEGNTSPSTKGNQRGESAGDLTYGHDGVYYRSRTVSPLSKFPIVYIFSIR